MILRSLLTILLLASAVAHARNLPQWQSLTYQQQTLWISAEATITVNTAADNPANWQLVTDSAVASNREQVRIDLTASSGRSLQRRRLSEGRQKRLKQYYYQPAGVVRERRSQPDKADNDADAWPITGRRQLPYPASAADIAVINAYSLLLLAADALHSSSGSVMHYVHTDLNFYLVESKAKTQEQVPVKYLSQPGTHSISGMRTATAVTVTATADPANADKPDFDLFGLEGEITILYDDETGIPLQLRGVAPRLGATSLDLSAVTMRSNL